MAESLYRGLQLGVETTYGTAVAATTVLPVDEGSGSFTLNKGSRYAEEDFGTQVAFLGSRGSHGIRMGSGSISADARFEDLGHFLQMMLASAVYTGAGPYTQTYTAGTTATTYKSYTVEEKTDVQSFIASGVVATSLELGYDAIAAGENSPWKVSVDLTANNVLKGTATAALTIPSVLETIEGHLTQMFVGTTATAFASLSEMAAHLVQYRLRVEQDKPLRPYGGTTDYATSIGTRKRRSTMSAMVKLSTSSITDIYDVFDAAGGAIAEKRWRIKASGSGTKALTIDHRIGYMSVDPDPDGRDGEYLLSVEGNASYDSTQASDLVLAIAGVANATLP